MPVLYETSRQSLQYRQLRKHPNFAQIWNTSYANKLVRLCQGIGKGICALYALVPWAFRTFSNTLAETAEFVGIGGVPDSGELGMFAQLYVL